MPTMPSDWMINAALFMWSFTWGLMYMLLLASLSTGMVMGCGYAVVALCKYVVRYLQETE